MISNNFKDDLHKYVFFNSPDNYHTLLDRRARLWHLYISFELRKRPELIFFAKQRISRWHMISGREVMEPSMLEWLSVLDKPLDEILDFIISDTEKSTQLRQSTPFVGVFPAAVHRKYLKYFFEIKKQKLL